MSYISKSSKYLQQRQGAVPLVTPGMVKGVSEYRKGQLLEQVKQGQYRDGGIPEPTNAMPAPLYVPGIQKTASMLADGGGGGWRGSGGTVRQNPEIYSPLWLTSNLNFPRDRATINAWCRAFFTLNPFVRNAILLHSTYPISKLNIKCKDAKKTQFFETMNEEIDLLNTCIQMAQEYWILGETFVFAELDERTAKWSRLIIENPDYMTVQHSVVAGEPIISIRPDENLRRIVTSNRPSDIQQRQRLSQSVIEHVKKNENIPLSNLNISHLANKIAPYETRGTGLPVACFKSLALYDKLKECFDEQTEILTEDGFFKFTDLMYESSEFDENFTVGTINYENDIKFLNIKKVKIACSNENNELEYHYPTRAISSNYSGKMYHFAGKKVDVCVTPNHQLYIKKISSKNSKFEKMPAEQASEIKSGFKFNTLADWKGKSLDPVENAPMGIVSRFGKTFNVEDYLKFLGYVISEGCVYTNYENGQYATLISVCQNTSSSYYSEMRENLEKIGNILEKKVHTIVKMQGAGYSAHVPQERWEGKICSKEVTFELIKEIGINGKADSHHKRIPRWVMGLGKPYLNIILEALVNGDGSRIKSKFTENFAFRYSTVCKELADDVEELVYKLGFSPNISVSHRVIGEREVTEYIVLWSESIVGKEPLVYPMSSEETRCAKLEKIDYNGMVWCFEVPTGLLITRRNNLMTVQGNCKFAQADDMINPISIWKIGGPEFKPNPVDLEAWRELIEQSTYDKNFKIVTHEQVALERVGAGTGIYDTAADFTQLIKELYTGLLVPSVIMDGGSDTSYANGGVALDVLRQRYMAFRNMLTRWLRRKIFAPIAKMNDFYERIDGEKVLIVPDVDWNHMSLFDTGDYITQLSTLSQGDKPSVSQHSLYRSLGLEYEEEQRKIRQEQIDHAIRAKEMAAMDHMTLEDLRTLGSSEEIKEKAGDVGSALPGELPGEMPGSTEGLPGITPPGIPPPPPPAPSGSPT